MIFSLILSLISIISYWKIFTKAGKPGWASIVPIYNIIVMLEITELPIWYIVLYLIPIANIYAVFKVNIEMAKKFGKSTGFGIGMVFLPIIFIPLLAFSDNVYKENVAETTTNNSFDATNVINNNADNNINTMNTIQNSIPTEPTNIGIAPINNVEVNTTQVVEPANNIVNENSNNEIPVVPVVEQNINPVVTEQVANISSVANVLPGTSAPIESAPVESITNEVATTAPVYEQTNEVISVVPETQVTPVEPAVVPNAFNQMPTMPEESINNVPETIEPVVVTAVNNEIQQPNFTQVETTPAQDVTHHGKKLCKNCGSEMPSIVSICPNCGTDNE
jgi:hypothetical protein